MLANANQDRVVLSSTPEGVQQSTNEVTIEKGHEVIASCSWKQTNTPTKYVPGTPCAFSAREFATTTAEGKDSTKVVPAPAEGQDVAAFAGIQLEPDLGLY